MLTALDIYDKLGRPKHEILGVLHPLVTLGFFTDWRVVRAYGQRGIAL